MIKPDGLQRKLVGNIISRFERKGFNLRAMKLTVPSKSILEEHYQEHKTKAFFSDVVEFMSSGPVLAMVWSFVWVYGWICLFCCALDYIVMLLIDK